MCPGIPSTAPPPTPKYSQRDNVTEQQFGITGLYSKGFKGEAWKTNVSGFLLVLGALPKGTDAQLDVMEHFQAIQVFGSLKFLVLQFFGL